jgi:hypothetical protein
MRAPVKEAPSDKFIHVHGVMHGFGYENSLLEIIGKSAAR